MANYTNLNNLNNIQPINLSFSDLTSITGATDALKETTSTAVGDIWFIGAIIIIFGMLTWWFYRPDKTFALDITRAILVSSSWCMILSIGFLLSGWITTAYPVVWFGTIFTASVVGAMKLKNKGL